jgi:hypothetical protein
MWEEGRSYFLLIDIITETDIIFINLIHPESILHAYFIPTESIGRPTLDAFDANQSSIRRRLGRQHAVALRGL